MNVLDYFVNNSGQVLRLTWEHIELTLIAVGFAVLVGVPLGILISYYRKTAKGVVGSANIIQAVPSMALLGLAIPLLGIGSLPSVVIVILYSLLPIIKNTFTGITSMDKSTLEAAKAIGLTQGQVLTKVQIPLALPVIMAGVRISAVTAVGLMTMAAFIGAGGLGFLIFSGISTTNNAQILAGAIPAAVLALLVDSVFGLVEKLVTPVSLHQGQKKSVLEMRRERTLQKGLLAIVAALLVVMFSITALNRGTGGGESITIGGKDFTEQYIVTHLMADLIEDRTDLQVVRKPNLGGTQVAFGALKSGDIDLYLEYTGTIYGDTLGYAQNSDMEEVYLTAKEDLKSLYGIDMLEQFRFNNTYVLSVTEEMAKQYGLKTISDLKGVSRDLTIGSTLEFLNREDGILGLKKHYGITFAKEMGINGANKYRAIDSGETQITDAFSTDGLLKKYNLVMLEDDQNFFPPYYAVPVLRSGLLEEHPELEPVLRELGAILTDEVMMELNYRVDELQQQPQQVSKEFLREQGLLDS